MQEINLLCYCNGAISNDILSKACDEHVDFLIKNQLGYVPNGKRRMTNPDLNIGDSSLRIVSIYRPIKDPSINVKVHIINTQDEGYPDDEAML